METASSVEPKKTRKYSILDRAKQAEAIREVVENKRTQREVAEEYGVSRPTVQAWARRVNNPKSRVDPQSYRLLRVSRRVSPSAWHLGKCVSCVPRNRRLRTTVSAEVPRTEQTQHPCWIFYWRIARHICSGQPAVD